MAVAEAQGGRMEAALGAAVGEGDHGRLADGIEEHGQCRQLIRRGYVDQRDDGPATRRLAPHTQLGQRPSADRLAQVDPGHGHVQGGLLVGLEAEVGQVVGVRVDPVSLLVLSLDRDGEDGYPLATEQRLVPLECLTTGVVAHGIAGNTVSDLAQAERPARVQQHQQQVGDALEPVQLRHSGHSMVPPGQD